MAAIAGIGFLMKYVLIPGKMRWLVYGKNVKLYFLGLGIILFLFSFVIKPEVQEIGQGKGAKEHGFLQGGKRPGKAPKKGFP